MSAADPSYLEATGATPPPDGAADEPADDSYLEVSGEQPGEPAPVRRRRRQPPVVHESDLRIVHALADDTLPLLAALWPAVPDLAREAPTEAALTARLELARTILNQVTRRSAEWRARAEVAGSALSRRLEQLGGASPTALRDAVYQELLAWQVQAFTARVLAEAGDERRLYAAEIQRLQQDAQARGLDPSRLDAACAAHGIELLRAEIKLWSECTALPGAPRTLDACARALLDAPSQGLAVVRDGALRDWLRANRAPDELLEAAGEAQHLAAQPATAALAVWTLAWALGHEGVQVAGLEAGTPETLLQHMRAARLPDSQVRDAAPVLAEWFRRRGHPAIAGACGALARDEAHALARLRWALGDPFRAGGRTVVDVPGLAREVLSREAARTDTLERFRDGSLRAWLEALPLARREARWIDDLARAGRPAEGEEIDFWRGIYRQVPRAPLRVPVGQGRAVRFSGPADLLSTSRVAAAWEPLKALLRSGELPAWLEVAAPGTELEHARPVDDADTTLNELLWRLGHTGLVISWGPSGLAVTTPADLVTAYQRNWQQLEAQVARSYVTGWLRRFHGAMRTAGVPLAQVLEAGRLHVADRPAGFVALELALWCGLDYLPIDPRQPRDAASVRGYLTLASDRHDAGAWSSLETHVATGTALLWAARHAPELGLLVIEGLEHPLASTEVLEHLVTAGVPVPSPALAGEVDTARLATEREAARQAAQQEAALLAAEREAARLAAGQEAAFLAAEREAARLAAEREAALLEAGREAARLAAGQEAAFLAASLEATRQAAEREAASIAAQLEATRAAAGREAALIAARQEAAREAAAREAAAIAALREAARLAAEEEAARRVAEGEAARLAAQEEAARLTVQREAARLATAQETARLAAEREAARQAIGLVQAERADAERLAAQQAAAEAARLAAEREAARLAAEREAARLAAGREAARLAAGREAAEREAARLEAERIAARLVAERDAARLAEQEALALAEATRLAAERDAARLAAEREAARLAAEREAARLAAEREAARLAAERDAARLAAERAAARLAAERDAARVAAGREASRLAAAREAARLAAAHEAARLLALQAVPAVPADTAPVVPEAPAPEPAALPLEETEPWSQDEEIAAAPLPAAAGEEAPRALPERHEIGIEDLVETRVVEDETTRRRLRDAVGAWMRRQRNHPFADLGERLEVLEVVQCPAFEVLVNTRIESRELHAVRAPFGDRDVVSAGTAGEGDPWVVPLPEIDTWSAWRKDYLVEGAAARNPCGVCAGRGRVACKDCDGVGQVRCPSCLGHGRLRCGRCVGAGEVATERQPERCPACQGRGEASCEACKLGRVPCTRCGGGKDVGCAACAGRGAVLERQALEQAYAPVAARELVPGALPAELVSELRGQAFEPRPVVHVEAPGIDPFALARAVPHAALGTTIAELLAAESARCPEGSRVTRQRLLVRRYQAYRLRYRFADRDHELWIHGAGFEVHATASPLSSHLAALVQGARDNLAAEDYEGCIGRLQDLLAIDPGHAEGRRAAGELGEAVLAMAQRGELFAAREWAAQAARLRWPECTKPLIEAEKVVSQRLRKHSPWALLEEARGALAAGRRERAVDRLVELARLEPGHAEGRELAAQLVFHVVAQARDGQLAEARALACRLAVVPWGECPTLSVELEQRLARARWRRLLLRALPIVIGVLALLRGLLVGARH